MPNIISSKSTAPIPDAIGAVNVNLTYPQAVLSHAIYVTKHIPELLLAGSGVEKKAVFSAMADVRGLHFLVGSGILQEKFKTKFIKDSQVFIDKFDFYNSKSERIEKQLG